MGGLFLRTRTKVGPGRVVTADSNRRSPQIWQVNLSKKTTRVPTLTLEVNDLGTYRVSAKDSVVETRRNLDLFQVESIVTNPKTNGEVIKCKSFSGNFEVKSSLRKIKLQIINKNFIPAKDSKF